MTAETDVTHRLVEAFPQLEPLLDEHLADQDGELLPYVFFGDVARWLDEHSRTEPTPVRALLEWLEVAFTKNDFDVRNLIDVGIVEMLPAMPEGRPVLELLGPALRERAEVAGLLTSP